MGKRRSRTKGIDKNQQGLDKTGVMLQGAKDGAEGKLDSK